ncbi:cytochrome c oxidase subunit CcoM [Marinobacter salexigens]|uniref:cytochrome c oxidase subunit CcoM n=1 Tax=Marinobacter salexigens TaxID=1925763 RepID=UPI0018778ADD|nr:cytochrome c oxidase subunit CcoM [Marinobacter salexigens]
MYMDAVVFAGIATVLLMVVFFIGVGVFVMRDQKAHDDIQAKKDVGAGGKVA